MLAKLKKKKKKRNTDARVCSWQLRQELCSLSLSPSSQAESGGERLFEALPLGSRVLWDPGVLTLLARLI